MSNAIDFDTAKNLTKFLSDKLRAHPGTTSPAKLLVWVAEFQGHRSTQAFKSAATTDESSQAPLIGDMTVDRYIQGRIQDLAVDFFNDHLEDVEMALKERKDDDSLDLEDRLYMDLWEGEEFISGSVTEVEASLLLKHLPGDVWSDLCDQVTARGGSPKPEVVINYLYKEALKDVLVGVLRQMNSFCRNSDIWMVDELTNNEQLDTMIGREVTTSVPAWLTAD